MKLRILSLVAAVALVSACESAPEQKGATTTGGQTAPQAARQVVAGSVEDFVANVGDRVFFDYDKFSLRTDAKGNLDKQVAWLKKYPSYKVTVEGHCDERGTREYNLALGEKRANAVKEYFSANGLGKDRVATVSYGKERPAAVGSNEAAWSQNRRGVTVLGK
ncbi:MAG: peptidoglycan-associated lipoprotein Pal [Magnetospirillum sp.]|nr:peptidoglycan-associated lipoprotein Pal [Magnetospirillum sp.]